MNVFAYVKYHAVLGIKNFISKIHSIIHKIFDR